MDNSQLHAQYLYVAALQGNVQSLLNLLQQDPFILDRYSPDVSFNVIPSPLLVSVNNGHLDFTEEILRRKPELTEEVGQIRRWSPLHVASGKGYLEIVKALIAKNPKMGLARDVDGLNPVHIAAVRGHVHVLDELVKVVPQVARERGNNGETVLHLCVKHCQIDALMLLVEVTDDVELLNYGDGDGNTILHLAVASKQTEMVTFLLNNKRVEKKAINSSGLTAMDIQIGKTKGVSESEIWLDSMRNALMIVASLIATMAFQVGINPPGGVWQDNNGHNAGNSVMSDVVKNQYNNLLICNTGALFSSLGVILLLISGLPSKRILVVVLMITTWIAVSATGLTYVVAVDYLTRNGNILSESNPTVWVTLQVVYSVWLALMLLLVIGHALKFIIGITMSEATLIPLLALAAAKKHMEAKANGQGQGQAQAGLGFNGGFGGNAGLGVGANAGLGPRGNAGLGANVGLGGGASAGLGGGAGAGLGAGAGAGAQGGISGGGSGGAQGGLSAGAGGDADANASGSGLSGAGQAAGDAGSDDDKPMGGGGNGNGQFKGMFGFSGQAQAQAEARAEARAEAQAKAGGMFGGGSRKLLSVSN